jgi:protocatechuate 3,4-dioxygenase beta subunit
VALASVLLLLLPAWAQQPQSDDAKKKGRVEGTVLSLGDGTPLPGASVRLKRDGEGFGAAPDPNESAYSGQAGLGGRYFFDGVEPGSYQVYADQPGYVRRFHGARSLTTLTPGTPVQVAADQTLKHVDVELVPQGSISGHLWDEDGEPVREGHVSALRIWYEGGHRELLPLASANTDVDGGFTLRSLPPGKYYVRADQTAPSRIAGAPGEKQRAAMSKMIRRTFYPEAESADSALAIAVVAGSRVRGIDFHMKSAKLLGVRGKVDWGDLGKPEKPLILSLTTNAFDLLGTVSPRLAVVHPDSSFAFDEVVPGTYYLEPARVRIDPGSNRKFGGTTVVEVRDEDVTDVNFRVIKTPDLSGRIQIEGGLGNDSSSVAGVHFSPDPAGNANAMKAGGTTRGAAMPPPPPGYKAPEQAGPTGSAVDEPKPEFSPGNNGGATTPVSSAVLTETSVKGDLSFAAIGIRLTAFDRVSVNPPNTVAKMDGSFLLPLVPPGRYLVETANLPEGTYVKAISFNGSDSTNGVLDLTMGVGGELDLLLSKEAGELSGTVIDNEGNALSAVWVSLWRVDRGSERNCGTAEVAITNGQGAFRFIHLAPGKYKAVAWAEIEYGLAQTAAFCRLFERDAGSITVDPRSRETVKLKPVPPEKIEEAGWLLH